MVSLVGRLPYIFCRRYTVRETSFPFSRIFHMRPVYTAFVKFWSGKNVNFLSFWNSKNIKKTVNLYLGDGNNSSKINERTFSLLIQDLEAEEEATLSKLDRLNMEINLQNNFNIDNSVDYVTNHFKDFLSIISDEEKNYCSIVLLKKFTLQKDLDQRNEK